MVQEAWSEAPAYYQYVLRVVRQGRVSEHTIVICALSDEQAKEVLQCAVVMPRYADHDVFEEIFRGIMEDDGQGGKRFKPLMMVTQRRRQYSRMLYG